MDFDYTTETITPDISNVLTIGGTGALELPIGTTAQRPPGFEGYLRFNTDLNLIEGYTTSWGAIPVGASAYVASISLNDSSGTSIYITSPTSASTGAVAATLTLKTQNANSVFAGPTTGAAQPTFRSLVPTDIPSLAYVTSVAVASTDLSISGSPITSSGTITLNINTNAVINSKLAQMPATTIKGNNTGSTANALDLTGTQVTALLSQFTSSTQGVVSGSGGGTTNFLRADGTWATPAGSGFTFPQIMAFIELKI